MITNLSISSNLTVTGTSNCSDIACNNITSTGDITFGVYGAANTLRFNVSNNTYNRIVCSTANVMSLYANNLNVWNADGTTLTINSDINCITNNANKTLTLESTNAAGYAYLTLKNRGTQQGSLFMGSTMMYPSTDTLTPMRFVINRSSANITAMTISTAGAVTMAVSPLTVVSTTYTSDVRLKENIATASLSDCKAIFDAVDVKTFSWKRNGQNSTGFIAQDVEAALPTDGLFNDLVNQSEYQPSEDDEAMTIKTIDYSRMAAVLWGVMKLQATKIAEMDARLAALEAM